MGFLKLDTHLMDGTQRLMVLEQAILINNPLKTYLQLIMQPLLFMHNGKQKLIQFIIMQTVVQVKPLTVLIHIMYHSH